MTNIISRKGETIHQLCISKWLHGGGGITNEQKKICKVVFRHFSHVCDHVNLRNPFSGTKQLESQSKTDPLRLYQGHCFWQTPYYCVLWPRTSASWSLLLPALRTQSISDCQRMKPRKLIQCHLCHTFHLVHKRNVYYYLFVGPKADFLLVWGNYALFEVGLVIDNSMFRWPNKITNGRYDLDYGLYQSAQFNLLLFIKILITVLYTWGRI